MATRKKPILVLTDAFDDSEDGLLLGSAWRKENRDRGTECDVIPCLKSLGFDVVAIATYRRPDLLLQHITEIRPEVIFNLTEMFHNIRWNDFKLTAVLDLLGIPYTGCRTEGLSICRDKALTKLILQRKRIFTPQFLLGEELEQEKAVHFPFPAIVKPRFGDSSEGVSRNSFVRNVKSAMARTHTIRRRFRCDAIIEEFVPGREIHVSVAEIQGKPTLLGRGETLFGRLPPPHIVSHQTKWDSSYRKRWKIKFGSANDLPHPIRQEINRMVKVAWGGLRLSGAARFDCRLAQNGRLYVLECNPNPSLARKDGFCLAAKAVGISYDQLILSLVRSALSLGKTY